MNYLILLLILALCSYFIGNINFALIISKSKHQDIRKMGSGNPGTLNMSRNLGIKIGVLTMFLDVLKGAIPTLLGYLIFYNYYFKETAFQVCDLSMYLCGFCAVFGHIFPVFLGFHGGKGIASTIGVGLVCTAVHGWWMFISIGFWLLAFLFIYFTEYGGMGSFIAITPPMVFSLIYLLIKYGINNAESIYLFLSNLIIFLLFFFTWFAHRKNICSMINGSEHATSIKRMIAKDKAKKTNI